ncbi:polysaccharide biosynthesis protein CapD [Limoniibacter endophyticus]|uniref:Polysaccharide biosynthesis protein CapD n=2 Tax=Limoniibacter endophyticus TaxID=1565040 RepID=A0A8J3DPS7_9HYPH|nr:polysaccharide biosynthesis protein CapD [Limoniibacter endophyticus]
MSLTAHLTLRVGGVILDLIIAAASMTLAYYMAMGTLVAYVPEFPWRIAAFSMLVFCLMLMFSLHRATWRYVSIPEIISIIKLVIISNILYVIFAFLLVRGSYLPRSVPILTGLFMIAGMAGVRLTYRLFTEGGFAQFFTSPSPVPGARNALLFGFNDEAEAFVRNLRRSQKNNLNIVGVVDDTPINLLGSVQGLKILGQSRDLENIVNRLKTRGIHVTELLIAESQLSKKDLVAIIDHAGANNLKVKRIPDLNLTSNVSSDSLLEPRPIEITDLLGRPETKWDVGNVAKLISGQTVLITGAGGSIGSELTRQVASFCPKSIVSVDISEFNVYSLDKQIKTEFPAVELISRVADVRDKAVLNEVFALCKPDLVFHAAALKHVPLLEENALEAIKTNVLGTRIVADAALRHGVKNFVMISTDKAVNPTNVMGATKRAAEAYCQSLDIMSQTTRFKTVRFGNVLGSAGSVVPRFSEQIARGGPVTVTHPQITRYFMTIPEAVRLVLHASSHGMIGELTRGKIVVLDMGEPVRIVDLAERLIQLAGFRPYKDIDITFTGLRAGEKLYEELFDPDELRDGMTEEGFFIASPRLFDHNLMDRSLQELEAAVAKLDHLRSLELLSHLVPEYHPEHRASTDPFIPHHVPAV